MSFLKKNLVPLSNAQAEVGVSNSTQDTVSGFLNVEDWDYIHLDIVAQGATVGIDYTVQTLDAFDNIIDLYSGNLTEAGSDIVELNPNPRSLIRTNVYNYTDGTFYASANLGREELR